MASVSMLSACARVSASSWSKLIRPEEARTRLHRIVREEGARLLQAAPSGAYRIALGSIRLQLRFRVARRAAGAVDDFRPRCRPHRRGPDGLSAEVLTSVDQRWSLSPRLWPTLLVRVVIAEQLYRAYAISRGMPYHRSGRVS